jgi:hypothetical protein
MKWSGAKESGASIEEKQWIAARKHAVRQTTDAKSQRPIPAAGNNVLDRTLGGES